MTDEMKTFDDFVAEEQAVQAAYDRIIVNVSRHGENLGWRGQVSSDFNAVYDQMYRTALKVKFMNATKDQVAEINRKLEHWKPVRQKTDVGVHVG